MKKQFKYALIAIIVVAAAVYSYIYATKPLEVETITAAKESVSMSFTGRGQGVIGEEVTVYPLASGEIKSIEVEEGQYVKEGEIICRIDYSDYEFQIGGSEAAIKAYEAQQKDISLSESKEKNSLAASKNDLQAQLEALSAKNTSKTISVQEQISLQESINKQLEGNLERAANNFENASKLYDVSGIPKQEYDDAKKMLEDAEKSLEQGKLTLATIATSTDSNLGSDEYYKAMEQSINAQISGIDKNLQGSYTTALKDYYSALIEAEKINITQLNKRIEDCTVKMPVSGKIDKLYIKNSNVLSAQGPVALIVPDNKIQVEVYVLTKDIVSLAVGGEAEIIFKSRDEDITIPAVITEIGHKAEEKLSPLGVMEKKVKVKLDIAENDIIKDGYDVDVRFSYYKEDNKITVPKTAVFNFKDTAAVWVVRDGIVYEVVIEKGVELRSDVVVESGLEEGDMVIKDANDKNIKEGIKVNTK